MSFFSRVFGGRGSKDDAKTRLKMLVSFLKKVSLSSGTDANGNMRH